MPTARAPHDPRVSDASAAEAAPSRRVQFLYFVGLLVLVALGYGEVLHAFFVADDYNILFVVAPAETLREATGIAAGWEFFRPLTAITFWLTHLCCGLEPAAYHAFDLVLHAINAWLVAYLAYVLVPHRLGAAWAGAWFAWFPTNVESVTWIAGRFDVLCVTGALLCVTGWLAFLLRGGRTRSLLQSGAGLVIALLAKDTGMIVPVLLGFLTVGASWMPASVVRPWRQRAIAIAGVVLVFALYFVWRYSVLGGFGGYRDAGGSQHLRIDPGRAFAFARDAVRMVVAPGATTILALCSLGLVTFLLAEHGSIRSLWGRVWPPLCCFAIALLPAANTVVLHVQTGENTRFLYLPAAFFCAGLGAVMPRGAGAGPTRATTWAAVLLLGCVGASLWQRNHIWREAGDQAATVLRQLDEFTTARSYQVLFIHGLPDTHRGAYVFRNGFESALALFVGPKPRFPPHGRISRADWDRYASERRARPKAYPEILLLRWDPASGRLVEP